MLQRLPALSLAALALTAGLASAQTSQPQAPSAAAVPAYRSALEGYRPFSDEKLAPWKESNDNVGRIGGWRVYAKEAQGAASGPAPAARPAAAAPQPASAPKPAASAPDPHSGHKH
jgi:hypothetical protein